MGKLSELQSLIKLAEKNQNDTMRDCLTGLFCLVSAELLDQEMYDVVIERIKQRMS